MKVQMIVFAVLGAALGGCGGIEFPSARANAPAQTSPQTQALVRLPPQQAVRNFVAVVNTVSPVIEQVCAGAAPDQNCDFLIAIDDRPDQPPNAYQTIGPDGRPILAFTLPLIAEAQNRDELAFIMGHEAGHHIAGHLARGQADAAQGAVLAGVLATLGGAGRSGVDRAAQIGAGLSGRRFSKNYELEADLIGTRIAMAAGYDPVLGAAFFDRLPDPGHEFLGSHPANADRKAVVLAEAARLRGQ